MPTQHALPPKTFINIKWDLNIIIALVFNQCHVPYTVQSLTVEESRRLARENAKDIIACGFDVTRTFIFSDFEYVGGAFYRNIARIQRAVSMNQVRTVLASFVDAKKNWPLMTKALVFALQDTISLLTHCNFDR
jgi:tryptophanyl-tRNA synthetase